MKQPNMNQKYFSLVVAASSRLSGGVLATSAIACAVFFLLTLSVAHEKYVSRLLSEGLREAQTEEYVVVRGTYLEISHGEVKTADGTIIEGRIERLALALAYKKALARYSPFFALPGVDTKRLRAASESLRATRERLASVQKTNKETDVVHTSLYPAEFIATLADLEDARREFLRLGSDTAASEYDTMLQKTLQTYQESLTRFRLGFQETVPKNVQGYAAMQSLVSRSGTLKAIEYMQDATRDIRTKIRTRELCGIGVAKVCNWQEVVLHTPSVPHGTPATAATMQSAIEMRNVFSKTGYKPDEEGLVELTGARCTEAGGDPAPTLFTTNQVLPPGGNTYRNIIPLDDIRFVSSEKYKHVPFFAYFHKRDIAYVPVTVNHYTCPEIGSDRGRVFGTLAVRAFARETTIYESVMTEEDRLHLHKVRASLLSTVAREQDAAAYLAIMHTYRTSMPKAIADELASLSLQMSRGTGGFEDGVFEVAHIQDMSARLVATGGPQADLASAYLFFVRSDFLSLFMALHGVGDTPTGGFFEKVGMQAASAPFIRHSSMRENWRERERAMSDMKAYHQVFSQ